MEGGDGADRPLDERNRGFRLLLGMGWLPGTGLGRRQQGIVEPLKMKENLVTLGLGKAEEYDEMTQAATNERRKLLAEVEETAEQEKKRLEKAARIDQTRAEVKSIEAAFFCDDCQKQYKTVKEMENHLSSYDHHHRKRLRDMQREQRQAAASDDQRLKRRKGEQQQEQQMLQRRIQQAAEASAAAAGRTATTTTTTTTTTKSPTTMLGSQKVGFALGKSKKPAKKSLAGISSAFGSS